MRAAMDVNTVLNIRENYFYPAKPSLDYVGGVVRERKSTWCNFIAWQRHRRNKRLAPRAVDCDV